VSLTTLRGLCPWHIERTGSLLALRGLCPCPLREDCVLSFSVPEPHKPSRTDMFMMYPTAQMSPLIAPSCSPAQARAPTHSFQRLHMHANLLPHNIAISEPTYHDVRYLSSLPGCALALPCALSFVPAVPRRVCSRHLPRIAICFLGHLNALLRCLLSNILRVSSSLRCSLPGYAPALYGLHTFSRRCTNFFRYA